MSTSCDTAWSTGAAGVVLLLVVEGVEDVEGAVELRPLSLLYRVMVQGFAKVTTLSIVAFGSRRFFEYVIEAPSNL